MGEAGTKVWVRWVFWGMGDVNQDDKIAKCHNSGKIKWIFLKR